MTDLVVSLDLETTGNDPRSLVILEIGAVAADKTTLEEISRFQAVIKYDRKGTEHQIVQDMHEQNGLWIACAASSMTLDHALDGFSSWVEGLKSEQAPILLGRNVGTFDRAALEVARPGICKRFHYRHLDLSSIALLGDWRPPFKTEWYEQCPKHEEIPHRAMDDALKALGDFEALIDIL